MRVYRVTREIRTPDGRCLFPRFEGSMEKANGLFDGYDHGDRDPLEGITCHVDGRYEVRLTLTWFDPMVGEDTVRTARHVVDVVR